MNNKQSLLLVISLLPVACVVVDQGASPSLSMPSNSQANTFSQCPTKASFKLDGKPLTVTVPNPFHGFPNPGFRIQNEKLIIELNTLEAGFFELTDINLKDLKPGVLNGDNFKLSLSYSPYSDNICKHTADRPDSKVLVEEYASSSQTLKGCFWGKLDCSGKLVEISAPFSGKLL
jgi:hypothetical protein